MKRKIASLCLMAGLIFSMSLPVHAEDIYGDDGWNVTFTSDKKMETNFRTADINDTIGSMQPGDTAIMTLDLKNENSNATDWYMKNEVLRSLEDQGAGKTAGASGSAYTYQLIYTDNSGNDTVLYDSDKVGGESAVARISRNGLKEATDALKDEYIYLDTLSKGQKGKITLRVGLDGETHGNAYQDTLADLQMNFAVERHPSPNVEQRPGTVRTEIVKTGDQSQLLLFTALALGSGLVLLGLSIYCWKARRKGEE